MYTILHPELNEIPGVPRHFDSGAMTVSISMLKTCLSYVQDLKLKYCEILRAFDNERGA
jgi:hypothetical protein